MKLGIFANTFTNKSPEVLFQFIAAKGIEAVHFNMSCAGLDALPEVIPDGLPASISNMAEGQGLELVGLSATCNLIHPDPKMREAGFRSIAALAKPATAMGVDMLSLCTGTRNAMDKWKWHSENESKASWQQLLQSMERVIESTEAYGLYLGIEPECENIVRTPSLARKLMDELAEDRVKIILDPANLFTTSPSAKEVEKTVASSVELLGDRVIQAHAKDRTLDGQVVRAGVGAVNFPLFIRSLRDCGYEGPLVMHGLAESEVDKAAAFLRGHL
jgi:sugar phosphate isomerase/epimerase